MLKDFCSDIGSDWLSMCSACSAWNKFVHEIYLQKNVGTTENAHVIGSV